jgi:hypothetical protein
MRYYFWCWLNFVFGSFICFIIIKVRIRGGFLMAWILVINKCLTLFGCLCNIIN